MFNLLALVEAETRVETPIELARWTVGTGLVVGAAVAAAALYGAAWLYRREGRGQMSPRARRILTGLRVAILMLVGLIGLEPVRARYLHRRVPATTLLIVDDSASMSVRDHYRNSEDAARLLKRETAVPAEGLSRGDLAKSLLKGKSAAWVKSLGAHNRVQAFSFSDAATPLTIAPDAIAETNLKAQGPATDAGRAVREAVRSLSGAPVAAVVLLSDGGFNSGESIDVLARYLASKRIPLHAVGLGDPSEPINIRVTEITAPRSAFARDPFGVVVQVAAEGMKDEPVIVELTRRAPGDDPESAQPVEQRTVRPGADGRFDPIRFECRVEKAGPVVFAARVPVQQAEAVESDNQRETLPPVQVLDRKMRVLLVAGAPSYDYRYLSRLLERDRTVDVSCWLQPADPRAVRDGTTVIDHLPTTADELYQYDVVLLLDPDPTGLPPEWAGRVASLVEEFGGGVLYAADRKHTTPFFRDARTRPIVDLLPVSPDPEAELLLNQLGQFQRTAWPLLIPQESAGSPLLRQADDPEESRQVWSGLDGVYWSYPVRREKPAATVLMRHGNPRMMGATGPQVIYAVQYVGAGRSAWVGFNSAWRWLRFGDEYYERFWISAIRYLTEGKLLGGRQRGALTTERDQYSVGDTVVVTLRALTEQFEPMRMESFDLNASVGRDAPRSVSLAPIPGRDGFYQGRFVADRAGSMNLTVALPSRANGNDAVSRTIMISQADLELRHPIMRRDLLERLAVESGGRYFDVDEIDQLPPCIEDRSESFVIRERPTPLWDNAWMFGLLIALLTAEWIGRKWAKLL